MAERRSPTPPEARPHGVNALHAALRRFSFPTTLEKLESAADDDSFEFRRGETIKLRDVLALIEGPRPFDTPDEALAAIFAALDERGAVDRRVSPPRAGRTDFFPY